MSKQFIANRADGSSINFAHVHYGPFNPWATFKQMSFINRWAGNIKFEYSVLQHSLLVADLIEAPGEKIYGLVHDVPEDGTGDLTGPFKSFVDHASGGFVEKHERHMLDMFLQSIEVELPSNGARDRLHAADMIARATELRDVVENTKNTTIPYQPATTVIQPQKREALLIKAIDAFGTYMEWHMDAQKANANG
ncbi:hypothetical protein [Maritalea porphyrae]|uniref:hypothetical protein n=1 Tax=Maritalea porphyrae TaxID=880732 RepID=UPI0022B05A1F|nr:hypothetical protein [Maritalea porphyrae]MCZ4274026.1 hypothetical protein [Maritalea porphyrae]